MNAFDSKSRQLFASLFDRRKWQGTVDAFDEQILMTLVSPQPTTFQLIQRYSELIDFLDAGTSKFSFDRTEASDQMLLLWKHQLRLSQSLLTLAKNSDSTACCILLRTQLEVFARLQLYLLEPKRALLAERANVIDQARKVEKHSVGNPGLPYSIAPEVAEANVTKLKALWPDLAYTSKGVPKDKLGVSETIMAVAETNASFIALYGLYQYLCGDSHANLLQVAARSNPALGSIGDEYGAALKMSTHFLSTIAVQVLRTYSADIQGDLPSKLRSHCAAIGVTLA